MADKSCIITIRNKYETLTAAERRAADFILQNSEQVIYMSVDEFAAKADVAKSAIIRCCKSLGFTGYAEMKIMLTAELSKNKQLSFAPYILPGDDAGEIMDKIFSANVKTLHDTAEKLDRAELLKVVDMLAGAKNIYIYAIGTSAGIANDFQYRLMQTGRNAFCFTDLPSMKVSTLNITEEDVAIGISHSGRTAATVDSLVLAKERGAKTMCITSCPGSAVTKVCDCKIEIYSDEIQYPMEALSSRIAHSSIIDAVSIALSARNYEDAVVRSKSAHELINTIRYKNGG